MRGKFSCLSEDARPVWGRTAVLTNSPPSFPRKRNPVFRGVAGGTGSPAFRGRRQALRFNPNDIRWLVASSVPKERNTKRWRNRVLLPLATEERLAFAYRTTAVHCRSAPMVNGPVYDVLSSLMAASRSNWPM